MQLCSACPLSIVLTWASPFGPNADLKNKLLFMVTPRKWTRADGPWVPCWSYTRLYSTSALYFKLLERQHLTFPHCALIEKHVKLAVGFSPLVQLVDDGRRVYTKTPTLHFSGPYWHEHVRYRWRWANGFSSSDESGGRGFQFSLYELPVCANNIMLNHVSSMKLRVFSLMKALKRL